MRISVPHKVNEENAILLHWTPFIKAQLARTFFSTTEIDACALPPPSLATLGGSLRNAG